MSDLATLVERAADGDEAAFRQLYDRYLDQVTRTVGKYLGPGAPVEEVVQEVFVELYESLSSVSDPENFGGWVQRVARNVAIDHGRKQATSVDFQPLQNLRVPVEGSDQWEKLTAREKLRIFRAALDSLSEVNREAVIMYEVEGLKLREIAEQTDTSINTIGSRVRRGREKLMNLVENALSSTDKQTEQARMSGDELNCDEVRRRLMEGPHGELSDVGRLRLEDHLADCPACRSVVDRTTDMFDTAREATADAWADIDADDLYDRIEAEIDVGEQSAGASHPGDEGEDEQSGGVEDERDAVWFGRPAVGVAAAAAALLLAGGWFLLPDETSPDESDEGPTRMSARRTATSLDDSAGGPKREPSSAGLPPLTRASRPSDAIRLFESEGADWQLHRSDGVSKVRLRKGAVLVEFLPSSDRTLIVQMPERTVEVVGTVFYARAGESGESVGVLEGAVEVQSPGGRSWRLKRRQLLAGGEAVRSLPSSTPRRARRHVDLEAHRRRLARKKRGANETKTSPTSGSKEVSAPADSPSTAGDGRSEDRGPSESSAPTADDKARNGSEATEPPPNEPESDSVQSSASSGPESKSRDDQSSGNSRVDSTTSSGTAREPSGGTGTASTPSAASTSSRVRIL
ncbi:MAG: sigma-70 family RNA polymerase sigma factor [Bradymonadaceae bacterium]